MAEERQGEGDVHFPQRREGMEEAEVVSTARPKQVKVVRENAFVRVEPARLFPMAKDVSRGNEAEDDAEQAQRPRVDGHVAVADPAAERTRSRDEP
jgi:hypothetical protein